MKKLKKVLALGLAASMILVGAGCGNKNNGSQVASKTSSEIVATIEGVNIPESLYRVYLWSTQQFFEQISGTQIWEIELEGRKTVDIAKERALESTILSVVTTKKAQELGVSLSSEELAEIQESAKLFEEINLELCEEYGFSSVDVEELLTATTLSQLVQEKISENYMPSEEDIKDYIANYSQYYDQVTSQHVLISTRDEQNETLPEAEVAEKRALAEDILARALAGEDMATLAAEYSDDPGSAQSGGTYTFGRGEMVTEFEDASFDGVDGEVWPTLVETVFGFHIVNSVFLEAADLVSMLLQYLLCSLLEFSISEFVHLITIASLETTYASV